jgi:hypothetical protein
MAKSIITQNGSVINYGKLLAIYVDENVDDDDNIIGYDLIGVTGAEKESQALILGSYDDEKTAENAKADIIRWLQSEAFSTFEMPTADNGGDA